MIVPCYNYRILLYKLLLQIMFKACRQATNILMSSYEQTALMSGISDIIAVKWDHNIYKTTPFLVCFGSLSHKVKKQNIKIYVNNKFIQNTTFNLNKYGYLQPMYPSPQTIQKFQLNNGKNLIKFQTESVCLQAQIHCFGLKDKIIISDMDGTMTKTDIMGIVSNYRQTHYIHDGYETFIRQLVNNGYKIVWLTMRSIAMYKFSKKYIEKYIGCEGALIPEPQQFFPSLKKQLLRKTSNIKTNMMKSIRDLFPEQVNPLAGGLGNRQNDALAYLALGIPLDLKVVNSHYEQCATKKLSPIAQLNLVSFPECVEHSEKIFNQFNAKLEYVNDRQKDKGFEIVFPKSAIMIY